MKVNEKAESKNAKPSALESKNLKGKKRILR